MIEPEKILIIGVARVLTPRSVRLATTTMVRSTRIAEDSSRVERIDSPNQAPAARPVGGGRPHSPRPTRGMRTPAVSTIKAARGRTRATIEERDRQNQRVCVSTGRRRS